ncbi:MAG: HD domain-containing protein [Nitrospirae bacterium]|nr:HD domain-containing protein [Nitrospirota bacterium]
MSISLKDFRESFDSLTKKVQLDCLVVGKPLPLDVYIRNGDQIEHLFYEGMIYTQHAREILDKKDSSEIFFDEKDVENFISGYGRGKLNEVDLEEFRHYDSEKQNYHQIERTVLIPGLMIGFSLYTMRDMKITRILEANNKNPVKLEQHMLSVSGDIIINKSELPLFREYLQSIRKTSVDTYDKGKEKEAQKIKSLIIRENSKMLIKELLEAPRSGDKIKEINGEVNKIIDSIFAHIDVLYDLLNLRKFDYYTYTHSVNVAVLSIGLANTINMSRPEIESLGIGAMLHDLGKSKVSHEVLNKQGGLTSEEFQLIKKHVIEGDSLLRTQKEFPEEAFPAVLQHHEKLTGRGYPLGIGGGQIVLFGRITSIVDCYDALTTSRPYKQAYTPYYALDLLVKQKKDYDCDLLKEFIKMLGNVRRQG